MTRFGDGWATILSAMTLTPRDSILESIKMFDAPETLAKVRQDSSSEKKREGIVSFAQTLGWYGSCHLSNSVDYL